MKKLLLVDVPDGHKVTHVLTHYENDAQFFIDEYVGKLPFKQLTIPSEEEIRNLRSRKELQITIDSLELYPGVAVAIYDALMNHEREILKLLNQ